jgi:hypothetical protein
MKIRLGILAVLASTILGAAGGTTRAAPQLITFDNDVSSAFNCFAEYPISLDSSNFLFKTASGNTPFAWNLADGCNTNPAIVVKGRQHLSPMRKMLPSLFP